MRCCCSLSYFTSRTSCLGVLWTRGRRIDTPNGFVGTVSGVGSGSGEGTSRSANLQIAALHCLKPSTAAYCLFAKAQRLRGSFRVGVMVWSGAQLNLSHIRMHSFRTQPLGLCDESSTTTCDAGALVGGRSRKLVIIFYESCPFTGRASAYASHPLVGV